jgi:hypothetical protein
MAEPEHVIRARLAAVFARQGFYEACERRDSAAVITSLNAGKITQGQVAARPGLAQSTLSNYKRGVNTAQFASTFETGRRPGPVTNQVTTTPGNGRQSATYSDTAIPPTRGNPTQPDASGRNWHAW